MSAKKMLAGVTGLLLGLGLTQVAHADIANFYECKGKDVSLTFSTSGIASSTYASLYLGKKNYTADDSTLETQATVMGDVKTLTLKFIPDVEIRKASFIIPEINLGQDASGEFGNANFSSQLILTVIATPFIAGPYLGVVNPSRYIDLKCKASLVF
ncbi:MAG: hypothetical protein Q7U57_15040 [Methylovulum sp.]|nr:hypothetical protein [Methylovulum sp.]